TERTQSPPPQSLALVSRTPCVEYGAGKVKGPRSCMKDWMVGAEYVGRTPLLVAGSTHPPGVCACAVATVEMLMAANAKPVMLKVTTRRRVPKNKTILLTGGHTGIDRGTAPQTRGGGRRREGSREE